MPDIQLRLHKDMLVLSAPIDAVLARQGIDASRDREYLNLMEPDVVLDALRLELMAGAQCLVTTTEDITKARLAHIHMDSDAARLAQAALKIANEAKPQHVLAEIGPCGLPLDASSKSSLNENRAQYADAARAFGNESFDAFFLNGFAKIADLKCALMGVAQVSDKPVVASMTIGSPAEPARLQRKCESASESSEEQMQNAPFQGYEFLDEPKAPPVPSALRSSLPSESWPAAIDAMVDLGVSVVGFETADSVDKAVEYARLAVDRSDLPVLAQLRIRQDAEQATKGGLVPLQDITEYTPDTISLAAVKLYGAGVQFLRATGAASPAYTGSLAATVSGLDVVRR